MTLLDLFDWLEQTTIGTVIRESTWLFPVVESVHLLGLALLGGAVVMNGRLLKILNESNASTFTSGTAEPIADTSFSDGRWTHFIKTGDKCFRVVEANPLDSLSKETWSRVKCR